MYFSLFKSLPKTTETRRHSVVSRPCDRLAIRRLGRFDLRDALARERFEWTNPLEATGVLVGSWTGGSGRGYFCRSRFIYCPALDTGFTDTVKRIEAFATAIAPQKPRVIAKQPLDNVCLLGHLVFGTCIHRNLCARDDAFGTGEDARRFLADAVDGRVRNGRCTIVRMVARNDTQYRGEHRFRGRRISALSQCRP